MDLAKYRQLFLDESREHLGLLNQGLLRLEGEGGGVDALFRAAHSLKGMAGSMGYGAIVELAHALEDVLDALRRQALAATPALLQLLFAGVDALGALVAEVEEQGAPRRDAPVIAARLRAVAAAAGGGSPRASATQLQPGGTTVPPPGQAAAGPAASAAPQRAATVRVDARVLDELVAIVGELSLTRERLERIGGGLGNLQLDASLERLRSLVLGLQEAIMSVHTLPLALVTDRLPRLVRDVARAAGKEVSFAVEGGGIAMDRAILAVLGDVLTHLVRNAVDHGVEGPAERAAAGKESKAAVRLRAGRGRDGIWIRVEDDGRGMDAERIAAAAVERGLVGADRVAAMAEGEKLLLCCLPGVSTAASLTEISGRGVGMDVVKSRVDACGGTLRIDSRPGRGTAVTLRLPPARPCSATAPLSCPLTARR